MRGAAEEERRDVRVVVRDVRLAAVMDDIAGIAHHVGPLEREPELIEVVPCKIRR